MSECLLVELSTWKHTAKVRVMRRRQWGTAVEIRVSTRQSAGPVPVEGDWPRLPIATSNARLFHKRR